MKSGRRTFLQFATLAPATAAAGLATSGAVHAALPKAALTRRAFEPLVGEDFEFETNALVKANARLVRVESLAMPIAGQDAQGAFRLVFECADGMRQDTFAVNHPRLGRFALFVSPNDREGREVEAIFNRV